MANNGSSRRCLDCGTTEEELYDFYGESLCWDCYKERHLQKYCDDMDDSLCGECGKEAEWLYQVDNMWVCEDCLKEMAEKVEHGY